MKYLVDSGADVNARNDTESATVLHWAAIGGNVRAVHFLATHGADVFASDKRGYNLLLHAVGCDDILSQYSQHSF